ncbi:MAG: NUDIX hydrolase [Lachnospiraceae bacterium]|nr:NUDIX hydrolase [Lachnospiraceae bacterium]
MEEVKRVERNLIHRGHVLDYYEDTMEMPDGKRHVWDTVVHHGAAAVVPVREDGKILFVRQYRNPVERETIEIPAGKKDTPDEDTRSCAVRELEEETGYQADHVERLLKFSSAIAYSTELIDIYLATGLHKTEAHPDEDEFIDVVAMSPEEIMEKIFAGTIVDSKTIAGVLAYCVKNHIEIGGIK